MYDLGDTRDVEAVWQNRGIKVLELATGDLVTLASVVASAGALWTKVHAAEKQLLRMQTVIDAEAKRVLEFLTEKWPKVERLEVSVEAIQGEIDDVRQRLLTLETRMVELLEVHGIKRNE